jgi:hypothetical protein
MTTTLGSSGRLCNQLIRNLAVSLIAEKHDLYVTYGYENIINKLGIDLFCGTNNNRLKVELKEEDYFSILNLDHIKCSFDPNKYFFQTKEISNFIYKHLNSDKVKTKIMEVNPYKTRYNNNNDVFMHIRLDDAATWNPGLDYYLNIVKQLAFENLYIGTDEKTHSIVKKICSDYPNAKILDYDEVKTIQFASTCKHVILSHGSFSAIIGYLSFFSNVNYSEYIYIENKASYRQNDPPKMWCGDMFSIDNSNWIKHKLTK